MKTRIFLAATASAALALSGCAALKGSGRHKTPTLGERIPILASESAADADKTIADVQVLLPEATANDTWAQPGGSAAKSLGQLALGTSLARQWTAQIDGGSNRQRLGSAPIVADGKLFAVDVDATIHAFDAASGAKIWTADIAKGSEKKNRSARFGGGASFDDGKIFATDGLGDVVAFDAKDGKELWRVKPGGPLRNAPTVALGQVYVLSQDNQLFALSQADGSIVWSGSGSLETQGVFGVAAPAVAQGTVVAGFSSGELTAYRYENGRTLWQDALSRSSISTSVSSLADIDADPVIDRGTVFAVGQGGRTVAIEIASGQRQWEQNFAGISTPWVAGEWLFLVTDDARLVCLARGTGKVRWIAQLQHYKSDKIVPDDAPKKKKKKKEKHKNPITWYGPVLAGGRLVLTNSLGQIVSAAPETGKVLATINAKQGFTLPPIVAKSTLYVLDQKGHVTAYK
ncbi:PQQ-binding-like beta-propeller repeat protein [Sphingomonas sp. H39-1-10]|uniref:outer membrane protein assembly factor BamB family protein n=1 Tax=Sphingomonas TaxID=13687 RepID=UPI00088F3CF3|nr:MULTISPECIES: PQQ-binding-like beta-propeller repeat protein [Sphingomonas]MDF0488978.1 PQQ-binding-like beta-propeller repeat protein [Sphingomonas pollutisoli]SDA20423.1 Outer membrane protein assembly factor BamB, contains PQQ-like beta-propeller repeat [Sphingomonas sp. NFR15]